jgi:hypothetical protein
MNIHALLFEQTKIFALSCFICSLWLWLRLSARKSLSLFACKTSQALLMDVH